MMITPQEVDLLAMIVQRAPILQTEIMFVNDVLNRLRVEALERQPIEQPTAEEREG